MDATVNRFTRALAITLYRSKAETLPYKAGRKDWDGFLLTLFQTREVRDEKDGLAFSMVMLRAGATRANKNVTAASALVFDVDGTSLGEVRDKIAEYEWVAYSTHSNTVAEPCYRLVVPLTRDVSPAEFTLLWNYVNTSLMNAVADKQCSDISRLYFLPSCTADRHLDAFTIHNRGAWLDPDSTIPYAPDREPPADPKASSVPTKPTRSFESLSSSERADLFAAIQFLVSKNVRGQLWIDAYDNWLRVGMALHASCENNAKALQAWKEVSKQSATWVANPDVAEAECDSKWTTFGMSSGPPVTLQSLLYQARQLGFVPKVGCTRAVTPRLKLKTIDEVLQQPPPRWLVRGLLQEQGLCVIYGSANAGKSFLAMDISLAIARGVSWFNRKVLTGMVVYVAIEGTQRNRLQAYVKYHQLVQAPADFRLIDAPLNLRERLPTRSDTAELIASIQTQVGEEPVIAVIIDTLNQALQGGDENGSEDMGAFVANVNEIRKALDCSVVIVHHAGKDREKGARGHSSLKGAVDTEIEVTYDKTSGIRTAIVTKQRDGRDDVQIHYMLKKIDLGPDPTDPNEQIASCVVVPPPLTMPLPVRSHVAPKGRNQKIAWQIVGGMKASAVPVASGQKGLPEDVLLDAVSKALPAKTGKRDRRRQQAQEAIDGMRDAGWVEIVDKSGVRHVVPGPRAGGLVTTPDSVPEMPEMPDLGVPGNLSRLGSMPGSPDFP